MMRNKEIRRCFTLTSGVALLFTIVGFLYNPSAGWLVAISSLVLLSIFFHYTKLRYQDIARLSAYISDVYHGGDLMAMEDNEEGELSILKNDLYKVTRTLKEQAELLHHDKKTLADALSDISHQIKTPLTSLFMMSDLLQTKDLDEPTRDEFLLRLNLQLERISWLISSLLTLSKIDAGSIVFKRESISLSALLERSLSSLHEPMKTKHIELQCTGDLDGLVYTDAKWTAEALSNVIKNGIEHSPMHGILSIACHNNPLHTSIQITNQGQMNKEDMPHVFERFYKGKHSSSDSVGIGLALAKSILQNQQADIEIAIGANSSPQSTTFIIKFFQSHH